MRVILSSILFFITGSFAFGQAFNRAKADSLFTALESHHKAMGVVTLRHKGEPVYTRAIGYRAMENGHPLPHSELSRFRVGSISKMFTSVMVFQLLNEGKLTLETKLSEYFPQVPNATLISIKQLLTHSSGLHNFTNDKTYEKMQTKPQTHAQMLKRFAGQKPDFIPGSKHVYSNTNFILLGYIIEKITGKSYADAVQERIAQPVGLKDTYYGGKTDLRNNECQSFNAVKGEWVLASETDMSIPHGAGSMVSTTADLGRFLEALFSEKLLPKKSLEQMTEIEQGYGHGIFKYPFGKKLAYGHSGGIDGFSSQAVYFPEQELAVTFCTNGMNYSMNEIMIGVLSIYFNEPYALPDMNTVTLTPAQLARYEGVYAAAGFPLKITLKAREGILTAQATGQESIALEASSETDFRNLSVGVVIKVSPETGPKVNEFLLKQGGQELLFKREK